MQYFDKPSCEYGRPTAMYWLCKFYRWLMGCIAMLHGFMQHKHGIKRHKNIASAYYAAHRLSYPTSFDSDNVRAASYGVDSDYMAGVIYSGYSSVCTIDLQWFAAEDEGRTEPPTEHKIRKAREEGKVARSSDLSGALILLLVVACIGIVSRSILNTMMEAMQFFLVRSTSLEIEFFQLLQQLARYFVRIAAPVLLVAMVGALVANIIQVGFLFTTKPIVPDFKRIMPRIGNYLQRVLFSTEAGFNLLKSWVKLGIIGIIGTINVLVRIDVILNISRAPLVQSVTYLVGIGYRILLQSAITLVIFALFDYQFQRYRHRESLKMTKQEVKEERKQQEGDPLLKSRMRQRMQSILTSNMIRNVPQADVVITNPTHFAVALEYDRVRMNAPTVIAKGADNIALRIREEAFSNDVPIIENKPLARSLHDEVEIGDTIPEHFYNAVVAILAEVYRLQGRTTA